MNILILGGTAFVGRHLVEAALARGHAVSVFHRGRTNAALPNVEHLLGERDSDLSPLRGRQWDAVIDTSAYVPRIASLSARLLADAVRTYAFISSVSVYKDFSQAGIAENAPRATIGDTDLETVNAETYGALKARAERAVAEHFPGRTPVIRPGIVVGPYDYTGRFAYWARRVAEGGDVLAPGAPERLLQVIDARDLADWVIRRTELHDAGLYNATGPGQPLTWGAFLAAAAGVAGSAPALHWIADLELVRAGITGADLPLWIPATPTNGGYYAVSSAKAQAAGLTYRPLAESIAAALEGAQGTAGLPRHREAELLRRFAAV